MSEEEKTIEEQTETIIDAIEAENDAIIEPETEDDVREAFEINKEDGPREALGAPLIKAAGDPEPADMTMIHKHLDNFLAKIAGETPIDENVRDSTEYWLNRIAEWSGGKSTDNASTKKIYWHTVRYTRATTTRYRSGYFIILNNSATPILSADIVNIMKTPGFVLKVYDGHSWNISDNVYTLDRDEEYFVFNSVNDLMSFYRTPGDSVLKSGTVSFTQTPFDVVDLGANPIN